MIYSPAQERDISIYSGSRGPIRDLDSYMSITYTEQASYDENYFELKSRNVKTVSPSSGQYSVSSPLVCGFYCRHSPRCRSFFFNHRARSCDLHYYVYDKTQLTISEEGEIYFVRDIGDFMPWNLLLVPHADRLKLSSHMIKNNKVIPSPIPKVKNVISLAYLRKQKKVLISTINPSRITAFKLSGEFVGMVDASFYDAAIDEQRNIIHYSPLPAKFMGKVDTTLKNNKLKKVFSGQFISANGVTLDTQNMTIYVTVNPKNNFETGQIMSMSYDYTDLKKFAFLGMTSFLLIFDPVHKDVIYNEGKVLSKKNVLTGKYVFLLVIYSMEKGGSTSVVPGSNILLMNAHTENFVYEIDWKLKTSHKWSFDILENYKVMCMID